MQQGMPGIKEWAGDADDLDLQYAQEFFFGKSQEDAVELFAENPIERADNIRWMPSGPFRYYIRAFAAYLRKSESLKDFMVSSAASCFLELLEEKLTNAPNTIAPVLPDVLPVAEYIAQNQDLFDADVDIFGDFFKQFERIQELTAQLKHEAPWFL